MQGSNARAITSWAAAQLRGNAAQESRFEPEATYCTVRPRGCARRERVSASAIRVAQRAMLAGAAQRPSFLAPRVRVRANLLSDGDKRRDAQQILVQDLVPAHRCRRQQTALYVYLAAGTSKRSCTSLRHGPFTSASRPVLLQEPPRPQAVDAIACRDYRDPRALLSPKFEPTPLFAMKVARA